MSSPSTPDLPSEQVSAILAFVQKHGIRSVHYVGNADRGLIEGLSGMLGKECVTLMDVSNRWGSGSRYFWDEFESSGAEFPECPEWLEDIDCYEEGAPETFDLLIRDIRWDTAGQLAAMIKSRSRKHSSIPHVVALLDARNVRTPAGYSRCEQGTVSWISLISPTSLLLP